MLNKAMERMLATGECLDVRTIGEFCGTAIDDHLYRLREYHDGVDYADATTERWIWCIGRHRTTGEYLAATDTRFVDSPAWPDYECVWLR